MTAAPPLRERASPFAPMSMAEIATLAPPKWLVGDLLADGGLCMLFAEPGIGKSLLALDLALSIAAGTGEWFGRVIPTGDTVYVAGEGFRSLSPRTAAWHSRVPDAVLSRFYAVRNVPALGDHADLTEFTAEIINAGLVAPRLVVIDTLARGTTGRDENDASETSITVSGLDYIRSQLDTTVLVVHHAGWQKGRERGSSALRAACDSVLSLERDGDVLTLRVVKQRDGETGVALRLKMTKAPPAVVYDLEDSEGYGLTKIQRGMLKALAEVTGCMSDLTTGLGIGRTYTEWTSAATGSRSTKSDAINTLIGLSLVAKSNDLYMLTEQGLYEVRRSD